MAAIFCLCNNLFGQILSAVTKRLSLPLCCFAKDSGLRIASVTVCLTMCFYSETVIKTCCITLLTQSLATHGNFQTLLSTKFVFGVYWSKTRIIKPSTYLKAVFISYFNAVFCWCLTCIKTGHQKLWNKMDLLQMVFLTWRLISDIYDKWIKATMLYVQSKGVQFF